MNHCVSFASLTVGKNCDIVPHVNKCQAHVIFHMIITQCYLFKWTCTLLFIDVASCRKCRRNVLLHGIFSLIVFPGRICNFTVRQSIPDFSHQKHVYTNPNSDVCQVKTCALSKLGVSLCVLTCSEVWVWDQVKSWWLYLALPILIIFLFHLTGNKKQKTKNLQPMGW